MLSGVRLPWFLGSLWGWAAVPIGSRKGPQNRRGRVRVGFSRGGGRAAFNLQLKVWGLGAKALRPGQKTGLTSASYLVDFPTSHTFVFFLSTLIIYAMLDVAFPPLMHVFSEMLINIPLSPVQLAPRRRGACRSC